MFIDLSTVSTYLTAYMGDHATTFLTRQIARNAARAHHPSELSINSEMERLLDEIDGVLSGMIGSFQAQRVLAKLRGELSVA